MLQAAVRVRLCRAHHLALPRARCDASWIDWRACAAVRHPGCAARRIVEDIIEGESRRPSVALGRSAPTGRTASTAAEDDAGAGRRKTKARTRRCSRHESLSAQLALPRNGATLPRRQGSWLAVVTKAFGHDCAIICWRCWMLFPGFGRLAISFSIPGRINGFAPFLFCKLAPFQATYAVSACLFLTAVQLTCRCVFSRLCFSPERITSRFDIDGMSGLSSG